MQLAAPTAAPTAVTCIHCGNPVETRATAPYCCIGCRIVHDLLTSQHLERYYDLRGERGVPVQEASGRRDDKWLDEIEARLHGGPGPACIELDVQGIHCSACVWLLETLFTRYSHGLHVTVDPTLGRARLVAEPGFDLRGYVAEVERFGYVFGTPLKSASRRSNGLVTRMGICIALAMNAMIFAIPMYAGLQDGPTHVLFARINLALSCASVAIGGTVFFRAAWEGLRRRVLHLDLPIAVGILLAFGGSLWSYAAHRDRGIFIDTLDVFIALMLVGRFLQERTLERNRLALLASDGVESLLARRIQGGCVETVRCMDLRKGDAVLVAPGDVVPLDATLEGPEPANVSLDWINGESRSHEYAAGARVPAGAFLSGARARTLVATSDFSESPLIDLLRVPQARPGDGAMSAPWWRTLTKWYVTGVLAAAAVGFVAWLVATRDPERAVEVATAVLIVTCPCAFGIATPLAYDLVQAGLRRAGLFVRSAGFLDRAARVRTVVFDKTGTLTTGSLRVANEDALSALSEHDRRALMALASASTHPKSRAVVRALASLGEREIVAQDVHEQPGHGVERDAGEVHRLGAPSWVAPGAPTCGDLVFGVDGRVLADLRTEESLRPGAIRETGALRAAGLDVWLLSGDEPARVAQTARAAGIDADHAVGGASPDGKAAWVAEHDHEDLLMVGDGINDALVVAHAWCGGTPAIDRPFMAARSDFYFVTPGLRCVRLALDAARKLAEVRRRNLALALAYNVLSVSLAYAGVLSPLVCAVLMPASSLTTILATTVSLNARSPLWRS